MAVAPELEPELGPEVEVAAEALPQVGAIAVIAVTMGIVICVDAICRAFFGTLSGAFGWIPYLGRVISSPIKAIEHKVTSFLGGQEKDLDRAMAQRIHTLARLLDQLWHNLELLAANIILLGALATAGAVHYLIHPLERWVRGVIRKVEEEIHQLERGLHGATVVIRKTITHVIYPQIRGAVVAVPRYIHRDLLTIRKEALHAEHTATRALRKVESIPFPKHAKTWPAAVALALPALGLDWLRCNSNPFKNNPNACGLWNDLKSLLGLLADVVLFANVCAFLEFASPFVSAAADVVIPALTDVGAGLCRGSIGPPPPLPAVTLALPPNPGVTLSLP